MRSRKLIYLLIAVCVVACVIVFMIGQNDQPKVESISTQSSGLERDPYTNTDHSITERPQSPVSMGAGDHIKKYTSLLSVTRMLNTNVNFYGRVVDQHGEPVPGVKIVLSLGYYSLIPKPDLSPSESIKTIYTNDDGGFVVVDNLINLTIESMEKDGYDFGKSYKTFYFDNDDYEEVLKQISDPASPVEFDAWRIDNKPPPTLRVISSERYGFIPHETYYVNLQRNEKTDESSGELKIIAFRPESISTWRFDWSFVIEAMGEEAGLIETNDHLMYEAPLTGYQKKISVGYKANDPLFRQEATKTYYMKFRNGRAYGRLTLTFWPKYNREKAVIKIHAWINPNGSRNLYAPYAK